MASGFIGAVLATLLAVAHPLNPAASAYVRVNQVGYPASAPKQALLMAGAGEQGASFRVLNQAGAVVFTGQAESSFGWWSRRYPDVYPLDLSRLRTPGRYTIELSGPIPATSPSFQIAEGAKLYSPLLRNALRFYEAQRDGPDVLGRVLRRRPSHSNDTRAPVYARPSNSNVIDTLRRVGGVAEVSGGWFDAGDYLKFVETASYVDALMLVGMRSYPSQLGPGSSANLSTEARFGLDWLLKMYNDRTRTLLYQVGVGDGHGSTILGDHDIWRRPQVDDRLRDPAERYLAHRPALRATSPGAPVSPNLAGRLAADFALCFQVFRARLPAYADRCLLAAEHMFDLAAHRPRSLTTSSPYAYYPETEWRDDLELGATELYYATARGHLPRGLPHSSPKYYLALAARWARAYLVHANEAGYDSLNLYDVSGLAHAELASAIAGAGNPAGLSVSRANLIGDCTSITGPGSDCGTLRDQLHAASGYAARDPFGLGFAYAGGDVVPHALGVATEAALYDSLTRTGAFAALARRQLDFVLGANAWGSSFVVGAGSTFPHCLQHQLANLDGNLQGHGPRLLLGATVDGPNADRSSGLPGPAPGASTPRPCSVPGFNAFDGHGVDYRDSASHWPNTEPTDDYTALTLLAFAQQAAAR